MAEPTNEITVDVRTLAAAFRLSYLAGRGDAESDREAFTMISRTCTNMLRSLRKAQPISPDGVAAGLDLIRRAAHERLGQRDDREFYVG